jgi:hypothetical protein
MKKHSTLCDSVEKNRRDVLILNAMRQVIEKLYLCGHESFTDIMARFVAKLMQQGLVRLCLALGALVLTPMLIVPLCRRQMNRLADQHHRGQLLFDEMWSRGVGGGGGGEGRGEERKEARSGKRRRRMRSRRINSIT